MNKSKSWLLVFYIIFIVVFFMTNGLRVVEAGEKDHHVKVARPDAIFIDTVSVFGKLERPAVLFVHDQHTDAMDKRGKDCSVCHEYDNNRMSQRFMRLKDLDKQGLIDIYHGTCIECHKKIKGEGEISGPLACNDCHNIKSQVVSSRQPFGFDKSLHFTHSEAVGKKCELCHHEYDEKTKKLFYAKEKEGTCRYCHREETMDNRVSLEMAAHDACINCHMKTIAEKKYAGPIKCRGCHDLDEQKKLAKKQVIPRIQRNQPDTTMVKIGQKVDTRMDLVAFDHKAHEEHNDNCRGCHHEGLDTCSKCHTISGIQEGNYISLERAMHGIKAKQSCLGCHENKKQDRTCAGCHLLMGSNHNRFSKLTCATCHIKNPEDIDVLSDRETVELTSAKLLESRRVVTDALNDEDIPEILELKDFAKKYQPVEFPHRKIVNTLMNNIKDNKLANYFHSDKETVCQGCHHNMPVTKKPSRCTNCHSKPVDEMNMSRPGVIGAYHIQCMGCHSNMGIDKVGCLDCHKLAEN
jgi:hypothetical protein